MVLNKVINSSDFGSLRSRFIRNGNFTGFREWSVSSNSATSITCGRVVWNVISSGKRSTLFKYLFLKWLWEELTLNELKYVLDLPEFHSSSGEEFFTCMKMLANGFPKSEIRTRLNNFRTLIGLKPHKAEKYRSLKQIKFILIEVEFREPPTIKFSGWVRHQNDQGSLRMNLIELDSEINDSYLKNEINLYEYLSVGKVFLLGQEVTLSLNDGSNKNRNG